MIREAEALPRGYGVAWMEPCPAMAACYPFGLHWVAGLLRAGHHAARVRFVPSELDEAYLLGFGEGRMTCNRDYGAGYEAGMAQAFRLIDIVTKERAERV